MTIPSVLRIEMIGFLGLLGAVIAYQLLTRQIRLDGIFLRPGSKGEVSPERVQLLMSTLLLSMNYVHDVAKSTGGMMPDVSEQWLYVFGASSGTYLGVKALIAFRRKATSQE
jgi:hypothetical protein